LLHEEGEKYKKDLKQREVKEPAVAYQPAKGKTLTIFNSFEEAEEDNYKWLASLTGEQHLQNAYELMKRIFAEDLKKHPKIGNKITIRELPYS
jgi:hypothetical protein